PGTDRIGAGQKPGVHGFGPSTIFSTRPGAGGGDGDKVRNLLEPPLVTEEAVKQGLLWLARDQEHDGSWSAATLIDQRAYGHRSPPGSVNSRLCNKGIVRASRVSLHGRKRGWRQQLAADVLDQLAILLRPGDHRDPFGIGKKSAPALLTLGHAVPGEHVGDLLAALADQRGPKSDLADAVLLPDPQRLVLEPRQQRRLAPRHAAVDPQFVDHGPS